MNNPYSEIIKTARNLHSHSMELFQESAAKASNPRTSEFFNGLAASENHHLAVLEKVEKTSPPSLIPLHENQDYTDGEFFDFTEEDIANIAANPDERDALNQVLEREQKSRDFYQNMTNNLTDQEPQELLQWLLKTKSQHCKMISYVVSLVSMKMLDLSENLDIPYISLANTKTDPAVLELLSDQLARRFTVFPISLQNGVLKLATSDPEDFVAFDTIENTLGYSIMPMIVNREEILHAIDREYGKVIGLQKNIETLLQNELAREEQEEERAVEIEKKRLVDENAIDAPIINFVNLLVNQAIEKNASDLHIEPQERGVDVRVRIDGILHKLTPPTKSMLPAIVSRIKILSNLDITEHRLPQDGHFRIPYKGIDIRVSTMPTIEGEKVVMRLLDKEKLVRDLSELGLEPDQMRAFQTALKKPQGVILVTGPTGSGKTTTLYSGLNYLLAVENNIVTIEDPVEYRIPYRKVGITQIQVQSAIGFNFATALRSILRQDPDIIMVGEIRDLETAQLAVRASLTGHLVLTTIHTNNAIATITRLQDMGIKTYMLGSCLNLIVAQRLVRCICERCKEVCNVDPALRRQLNIDDHTPLFRGSGCKACMNTGYRGRVAIYEMMPVNSKVGRAITNGASESELIDLASEQGMISLRTSGIRKIEQGITTVEEILAKTVDDN